MFQILNDYPLLNESYFKAKTQCEQAIQSYFATSTPFEDEDAKSFVCLIAIQRNLTIMIEQLDKINIIAQYSANQVQKCKILMDFAQYLRNIQKPIPIITDNKADIAPKLLKVVDELLSISDSAPLAKPLQDILKLIPAIINNSNPLELPKALEKALDEFLSTTHTAPAKPSYEDPAIKALAKIKEKSRPAFNTINPTPPSSEAHEYLKLFGYKERPSTHTTPTDRRTLCRSSTDYLLSAIDEKQLAIAPQPAPATPSKQNHKPTQQSELGSQTSGSRRPIQRTTTEFSFLDDTSPTLYAKLKTPCRGDNTPNIGEFFKKLELFSQHEKGIVKLNQKKTVWQLISTMPETMEKQLIHDIESILKLDKLWIEDSCARKELIDTLDKLQSETPLLKSTTP